MPDRFSWSLLRFARFSLKLSGKTRGKRSFKDYFFQPEVLEMDQDFLGKHWKLPFSLGQIIASEVWTFDGQTEALEDSVILGEISLPREAFARLNFCGKKLVCVYSWISIKRVRSKMNHAQLGCDAFQGRSWESLHFQASKIQLNQPKQKSKGKEATGQPFLLSLCVSSLCHLPLRTFWLSRRRWRKERRSFVYSHVASFGKSHRQQNFLSCHKRQGYAVSKKFWRLQEFPSKKAAQILHLLS